jgi:hypothetical protein
VQVPVEKSREPTPEAQAKKKSVSRYGSMMMIVMMVMMMITMIV